MKRLDNKVILITGAGSGIGAQTAELFHHEGANVVALDISGSEKLTADRLGDGAVAVRADVARSDDVRDAVSLAVATFGNLDAVVNCAGIDGEIGPLTETTDENCVRVLNVNLTGTFLVMKYAIMAMLANGGGSIVNISSAAGVASVPTLGIYGASKAGVIMLTRSTAAEYAAKGIRVNVICPGAIDTPLLRGAPQKIQDAVAARAPIGRAGTTSEIANAALFLTSDEASYVTGATLSVDGGMIA
jgi:NAD(P)-dependent dehydrogenase (short-subunit alcohol dehydrogenase family)